MYKCSAKAQLVLDQVTARCQKDTETNNTWNGKSGKYMFIAGRENADGKAMIRKAQEPIEVLMAYAETIGKLGKRVKN